MSNRLTKKSMFVNYQTIQLKKSMQYFKQNQQNTPPMRMTFLFKTYFHLLVGCD